MNILMMTNTYAPMVGGLERSVAEFTAQYRKRGHRVMVVAPAFKNMPKKERDVIRVPAIPKLRGSDFSLQVPIPGVLSKALRGVKPDVIHAHHPFLVGATALRLAYARRVPLVFTHHTLFEHYTHFLPLDSQAVKRFVVQLATGYANLCDRVFAPSQSAKELLLERGVQTPIDVVPTGIALGRYKSGDGHRLRKELGIPPNALTIGHVGRLGPEKNLEFLSRAVSLFLHQNRKARFLLVGEGPSKKSLLETFRRWGVEDRVHDAGMLQNKKLVEAYHAMDLFAFSSKSETQGLVVLEALASGVPVVAIRGPGIVDMVLDRKNGYLLDHESMEEFAGALHRFSEKTVESRRRMAERARATAAEFSMERCADRALELYGRLGERRRNRTPVARSLWARTLGWMRGEWGLVRSVTGAAWAAVEADDAGSN